MPDRAPAPPAAPASPADSAQADDLMLARALAAVGRARALGMHFYGHVIGVGGGWAEGGRSRLHLEGEPPGVGAPEVSAPALATVADLALGAAIRSLLEKGTRLGTVTLTMQHPTESLVGPLLAEATALGVVGSRGVAQSTLSTEGVAVAMAQGWFSALPPPEGRTLALLPWERDEHPAAIASPALADLDEREARAVGAARAAGARAAERGTAVSSELLGFAWSASTEGRARGILAIGPELANRVGHLQGGALYGAAALAAARALGLPPSAVLDGHYQFLRPADGAHLTAEASVTRRGRSVAFVESRLSVDGVLIGLGLFTVRPAAT